MNLLGVENSASLPAGPVSSDGLSCSSSQVGILACAKLPPSRDPVCALCDQLFIRPPHRIFQCINSQGRVGCNFNLPKRVWLSPSNPRGMYVWSHAASAPSVSNLACTPNYALVLHHLVCISLTSPGWPPPVPRGGATPKQPEPNRTENLHSQPTTKSQE